MRRWLLPEYIEDILPAEAARIEALRRRLLDLFRVHGYELVMPPLLEYLESLLTGTGLKVLDNQNRPITIAGSVPPRIEPDGAISVSGAVVARVQIVQAPNDTLVKDGDSLFAAANPTARTRQTPRGVKDE